MKRTLQSVDRKRLNADGAELSGAMRGVTIARPVRVKPVTHIGKEVTVDPTDTDEAFTAEMLSATNVQEYHDPNERLDGLRAEVLEEGVASSSRETPT